jgi:hypothetical protein
MLSLQACNNAASPEKVQHDVADANASAAKESAKADDKEAKVDSSANNNVADALDKADAQKGDAAANTMVADAEGANKIALAKCEVLSGDAQSACKDQANAALDMAKAKAKALKAQN